ncbi:MAG TPA: ribosome biogenesis GTPase Der [Rubrobacter sp.]|nr:ribosome biogenesis GTPase Der [Rubrobacter sp.]
MSPLPVVAVVGAPNVGKSSLVNRIMRRRNAVVSEQPGTTRDRAYNRAEWAGREFTLVDTGGMEPYAKVGLQALVTLQARVAVEEADVVLHLTDARLGPTEADAAIARELRRKGKTVLAVNKLDNPADDTERHRFYSLGEGEPHAISAIHGLGVGDLLDVVVSLLPEHEPESEDQLPKLAIVGRPNVGKSTLLNRLLGTDRAVVSEKAGTTTDAVAGEVEVEVDGEVERYLLLDTAGVSKSARRASGVPYYSALRTSEAIRRSDVALLLVDAVEGIVAGDLRIAREIEEAGSSCGVLTNKRDLVPAERLREIEGLISARLTDLKPRAIAISALEGAGVDGVLPFAARIGRAYRMRVSTHELAEFINDVVGRSAPPRGVKIRYATQTGTAPPRFTLFANRPKDLPESYLRYLENALRQRYGLWGVSVRIRVKSSR